MKKYLLILPFFLISFCGFSQSMVITYVNDSLEYSACGLVFSPPVYDSFTFKANLNGYSLADTFMLKADFGDGTYQTIFCYSNFGGLYINNGQLQIHTSFTHTYLSLGTFDVTYYITDPSGNTDTLFRPAEVILTTNCSAFFYNIFVDNNSNCIYDAGDSAINNLEMTLYNGVSVYGIDWNYYAFGGGIPNGINYTAFIDPIAIQQLGYTLTCPASGMINFTSSGSNTLNFAVNCNSNFDLGITSYVYPGYKIGNSSLLSVGISDISCVPKSGTYTLTFDPLLSYVNALNPPSSGSGSTYTWNFSNLATVGLGQGSAYNLMYVNLDPSVQLGDILCYTYSVSPTVGDIDLINNTGTLCAQVVSAFDPNFKEVSPKGVGVNGSILPNTKLTYTIGYQNTGNDTARNVFVMDTLSNNVDVNTLRVLNTTFPMQLYIIDGHILKFDFPNIYLPDSGVNEMASHGFFAYEIEQKPNLTNGTQIQNAAAIYFDYNAPVITNTTLNTINTALAVESVKSENIDIYPNPFSESITIEFKNEFTGNISLNDITGRVVQDEMFTGKNVTEYYGNCNPGIYILVIKNSKGETVSTKKLVKE